MLSQYQSSTNTQNSRAVYAFSADPITFGHINLVERISHSFQEVIVGIGRNPLKEYLFTLKQRLDLAKQALQHLPNVKVVAFRGMVVDFALTQGANIIVKGVRNAADFDYEQTHHLVGLSQQAGIDTHILFADPQLAHVSSSAVKAIQSENGSLIQYVPLVVKSALERKISNQLIIGVTGEIGTGKSTLCRQLYAEAQLAKIPLHHINIDKLAHRLIENKESRIHSETQALLTQSFGRQILEGGKICRQKLGSLIFSSISHLEKFNQILRSPMTTLLRQQLLRKQGIILFDGAYLVEADWLSLCNNQIILTHACSNIQHRRLQQRGYSQQQILSRKQAQISYVAKKKSINNQIYKQGFGHMWYHNTSRSPEQQCANNLLRQIIDESKANDIFKGLNNECQ